MTPSVFGRVALVIARTATVAWRLLTLDACLAVPTDGYELLLGEARRRVRAGERLNLR
jgi:hypothetical protein